MRSLLHFAVIGGLLFAAVSVRERAPRTPPSAALAPATSAEDVLFREALARGYHRSDPLVRNHLIRSVRFALSAAGPDAAVLEEALALGLHETDAVVRERLVQKMTLLAHGAARGQAEAEAELRAYWSRHPGRWRQPARFRLQQRYYRTRARAAQADPAAPTPSDPLPEPERLPPLTEQELASRFGPAFAEAVAALPGGRWSDPLPSAYGYHRVRVLERMPESTAQFDDVRAQLREALLAERGEAVRRAWVARLRGGAPSVPAR